MDEADSSKNLITPLTFSNILEEKRSRQLRLYQDEPASRSLNQSSRAEDVIQKVIADVKTMRKADNIGGDTFAKKHSVTKKYNFVPLSLLAPHPMEQKHNKCETQGVTDTQMLDAADGADAVLQMISHKGMTQMFDVSFSKKVNIHKKVNTPCEKQDDKSVEEESYIVVYNVDSGQVEITEPMEHDRINDADREFILDHVVNFRPPSPVLTPSVNNIKRRLEKEIKNKQLKRKLNEDMNEESKEPMHKRLKVNHCIMSKGIVNETMSNELQHVENQIPQPQVKIFNENIEDEIIFSSDEEFDVKTPQKFLPLTCKIYNNVNSDTSSILDESLYVFFTTASDKSIQVSRDSFERAKKSLSFLLDEDFDNHIKENIPENKTNKIDNSTINITNGAMEKLFLNNDTPQSSTVFEDTPFELRSKICFNEYLGNHDNIFKEKKCIASEVLDGTTNIQKEKTLYAFKHNGRINISNCDMSKSGNTFENMDCDDPQKCITSSKSQGLTAEKSHNIFEDVNSIENKKQYVLESEEFRGFQSCVDRSLKDIKSTLIKAIETLSFEIKNADHNNWLKSSNETSDKTETKLIHIEKSHKGSKIPERSICRLTNINNITLELSYASNEASPIQIFQDIQGVSEKKKRVSKLLFCDEEILNKIKNINNNKSYHNFQQIKEFTTSRPAQFQGLTTASNNKILLSEEALVKSKLLFADEICINKVNVLNEEKNKPEIFQQQQEFVTPGPSRQYQGFTTASRKAIKVSEKALAKSKLLFSDEGNINKVNVFNEERYRPENPHQIQEFVPPGPSGQFQGFTTASNKTINVSEEALAKSKLLFAYEECIKKVNVLNEEKNKPEIFQQQQEFATPGPSGQFQGFTTANNKTIKISEEALAKSKLLFIDEGNINNVNVFNEERYRPENLHQIQEFDTPGPFGQFQGFTTASNKTIKVSEEALAKSKKLFSDEENINKVNVSNKEIFRPENIHQIQDFTTPGHGQFQGFTTANNKTIKISEEALAKSKLLFSDDEIINNSYVFNGEKCKPNNPQQNQELSILNNNIIVSEDMINRRNDVMVAHPRLSIMNSENTELRKTTTTFQGFTTASNKTIKVTEDALAKTRNIFQEFDEIKFTQFEVAMPKFTGFTTAGNKNVTASKQALDNIEQKIVENYSEENRGSTKNIEVSVEAPEKYKSNFHNLTANKDIINKESVESIKVNSEELLNSQIQNNFEETLCSEDFTTTTKKYCVSPILPSSSAKRRKTNFFKVPYRVDRIIEKTNKNQNRKDESVLDSKTIFSELFTENYKSGAEKRIKLQDLKRNSHGLETIGTVKFDFNNLSEFRLDKWRNDLTNSELCIKELSDIFLKSVDDKIIPKGWLENHMKLILWKLISYENVFPDSLAGVATAKNVLQQLKYRFDRELNKVERPILRKILERDEAPSRYMVLCIVRIFADGQETESVTGTMNLEIEVTDGWYCVRAIIDKTLSKAIVNGKLVSGTKIATHSAELLNCDQGKAPWEDISSVRLKLSGNSTRPAAWHARLGAQRGAAPPCALRRVAPDGGRVGALRAHVARVYPPLYVERFGDGSTVTRSERLEALHAARHESELGARLERVYEEAEREFSQRAEWEEARECPTQVRALECREPTDPPTNLTESQVRLLNDYNDKKHENILQRMQARIREKIEKIGLDHQPRNVVSLLKVRLCGWRRRPGHSVDENDADGARRRDGSTDDDFEVTKAVLSIWKPSEYLMDVVKEGVWIDAMNVVPTAVRMSELHISAGRQSIFRESHKNDLENASFPTASVARKCIRIKDLQLMTGSPTFNEVDTVGLVVQIEPETNEFDTKQTRHQSFQNVYLADTDGNLVCINFWGGLKKFGYERVLETGQFVACSNLQTRMGNSRKSTPQFRVTELTTFTKVPRNPATSAALEALKKDFENVDLDAFCRKSVEIRSGITGRRKNPHLEEVSPYRFNNRTEYNLSKHKAFIDSPLAQKPVATNDLNLTGLDFESTFKHETQVSKEEALRKSKVQSRMQKLKMYGEPPPLSTIHIINKSFKLEDPFKSPIAEGSGRKIGAACSQNPCDTTDRRATESPDEYIICANQLSPVLTRNNSAVSKSFVNPVKLNFDDAPKPAAHNDKPEGSVDYQNDKDFSEEFDFSPPLSLDVNYM